MKIVPRVRPLVFNTEKETALYCILNQLPFYLGECPYAAESFRGEVKDFLNGVEEKYPGTKFNLLHSFLELKKKDENRVVEKEKSQISKCVECGYPSSSETCKACNLKALLST